MRRVCETEEDGEGGMGDGEKEDSLRKEEEEGMDQLEKEANK